MVMCVRARVQQASMRLSQTDCVTQTEKLTYQGVTGYPALDLRKQSPLTSERISSCQYCEWIPTSQFFCICVCFCLASFQIPSLNLT